MTPAYRAEKAQTPGPGPCVIATSQKGVVHKPQHACARNVKGKSHAKHQYALQMCSRTERAGNNLSRPRRGSAARRGDTPPRQRGKAAAKQHSNRHSKSPDNKPGDVDDRHKNKAVASPQRQQGKSVCGWVWARSATCTRQARTRQRICPKEWPKTGRPKKGRPKKGRPVSCEGFKKTITRALSALKILAT